MAKRPRNVDKGENKQPPRKIMKQDAVKRNGGSPKPSDGWPTVDFSQLLHSDTIRKILTTGNWDFLRSEASKLYPSTQRIPCSIDLTRFATGRQNVVLEVAFADGTYWVVRVPLTEDVETQMLSEVATMKLVLQKTSIPVPSVFGFDHRKGNPFGFPYMFMSALSGRTLDGKFALSIPEQHKAKVASQLARYWYELSQITFDRIGRIWSEPGADDYQIISLPSYGVRNRQPGFYGIGPFRTSCAYLSGIRRGMDDMLRAQHQDAWPQWQRPCRALRDAIPLLSRALQHQRGPFPLSHPDLHYGNIMVDDNFNVTGIIDWTNAHTAPVEAFATLDELMIPRCASKDLKEAIAHFRDLFTHALKNLESTQSGATCLALSGLFESSTLTVVHRWLLATQIVPHSLQAAMVYANSVLQVLYGDGIT
ncbi:kinase-like domain-containing protein, partial [Diplogelasinospora grovesii]